MIFKSLDEFKQFLEKNIDNDELNSVDQITDYFLDNVELFDNYNTDIFVKIVAFMKATRNFGRHLFGESGMDIHQMIKNKNFYRKDILEMEVNLYHVMCTLRFSQEEIDIYHVVIQDSKEEAFKMLDALSVADSAFQKTYSEIENDRKKEIKREANRKKIIAILIVIVAIIRILHKTRNFW